MITRNAIAVLAIALLTACSQQSGFVAKVPIAKARQILLATGLPPQVFGTEPPDWEVRDGESDVTWVIKRNDTELFHYTAHLTEADQDATRVDVELVGAESSDGANAAKGLAEHPEIRNMYLVAINERIASALEQRPFEIARVYPALAAATAANMSSIQASADQAAAASQKMDRENMEKAYRDEAAGR